MKKILLTVAVLSAVLGAFAAETLRERSVSDGCKGALTVAGRVGGDDLPYLRDWMGEIVNHPIDTNEVLVADAPKDMALFLLIGQSNMAGRGTVTEAYRTAPAGAYKFNRDGKWARATAPLHDDRTTAGVGLGDAFIREYLTDHPGAHVGVIPCAIGGSHSALWSPEPERGLIGRNFHRAIRRAKAAQANGRIVGILWHQGEADCAQIKMTGGAYYPARLAAMAAAFRRMLGEPDVPFVLGETGTLPMGTPEVVNPKISEAAARIPNAACARAADLTGHMPDGIHFDTPTYRILGERYYAAWKKLAEGPKRPAWNGLAVSFLDPPAFDFPVVPRAGRYRYRVIGADGVLHDFTSPTPTVSLACVWDELPTGRTEVWCEGYDGRYHARGRSYRAFWKSAPFRAGAYPKAPRSFAEAAKLGYDYLLNLPFLKTFAETGKPDPAYRLNCYPSKMHAATILAMVRLASRKVKDDGEGEPQKERALKLAKTAADYLLSISQPPDAPLAWFPPTYAGTKLTAARYAGMNMLIYPADVGAAYIALYGATKEAKYLAAAENIAKTYRRLQGTDGTWPLKVREKDGVPVNANRLLPIGVIAFFDALAAATGKTEYTAVADRAFAFYENGPVKTWNWEGQFEDVEPDAPYLNLQSHAPLKVAMRLLKRWPDDPERVRLAGELIRFVEDQFCYWERPYKREKLSLVGPKWEAWEVEPAVVEQYHYREVTDASTAALASAFAAYARVTGDNRAREKAIALGAACVRIQRPNGRIPTLWSKPSVDDIQEDWINCMAFTISALDELSAW